MLIYVIYMLVSRRRKIRFFWTGFIPGIERKLMRTDILSRDE